MSSSNHEPSLSALTLATAVWCPHCGERVELVIDLTSATQQYVEDCHVCCRPIVVACTVDNGELVGIAVERENE